MNAKEFKEKAKILYELQTELIKELKTYDPNFRPYELVSYDKEYGIDVLYISGDDKYREYESICIALDLEYEDKLLLSSAIEITNTLISNEKDKRIRH